MMLDQFLADVPSPCLIVDLAAVRRNIDRANSLALERGVTLRPHFKAHKTTELLRMQSAAPASRGVSCQTSWEAITLATRGFADILVTNQIVDPIALQEIGRAARLARVTVAVDASAHVDLLDELTRAGHCDLGVIIEVDVGFGRCGVAADSPELVALAQQVDRPRRLELLGIQAYAGHAMLQAAGRRTESIERAAALALQASNALLRAGFACPMISGGGTGSLDVELDNDPWTENQAGSYVLMDTAYAAAGAGFEQALYCLTRLISHNRRQHRGVLNAGLKQLAADHGLPAAAHDEIVVRSLSDEHAAVTISPGTTLEIGDPVLVVPAHVDPTVNLHDSLFVYDSQAGTTSWWPVDGRRTTIGTG